MPRDQIDFQSCDILKSSLDIFLFTQTQVNRLCTKLPGWSPKAYHVQEVKPEELTVSSKHQSFMNLLLKFCFQCLIPFPATATGQAAPGHGRGGQKPRDPLLWLWLEYFWSLQSNLETELQKSREAVELCCTEHCYHTQGDAVGAEFSNVDSCNSHPL